MIKKFNFILLLILSASFLVTNVSAQEALGNAVPSNEQQHEEIDVRELILEHLADTYEWHLFTINEEAISIPLPIILISKEHGFNIYSSSVLEEVSSLNMPFYIAPDGPYKGKIVERNRAGDEVRPLDLSITKNAASILLSSLLLILIIMSVARHYKEESLNGKKGFSGGMEFLIESLMNDVIRPSIGKEYRKYAPFVLTLFFFIFFNNLLGLVPFFPGGANVTGNISVTLVLALFTFLTVNLTGSKSYYKDLFWPDVPTFLKAPFPLMQIIELVGTITKPFALMIRLFANMTAGHSIMLGLTSLVFVTVSLGAGINSGMTVVSVFFNIFIFFLEMLVAFIQAYIFTILTSVFIGLARTPEPRKKQTK
ncbi:MAG TPA: F0F1 ATP synthase subunit A [Bacteroidales bacterium]|nr:F0F1 ATP synthase subunit A [Bacteroidales bacterium]